MPIYFSDPANKQAFLAFVAKIKSIDESNEPSQTPNLVPHLILLFDVLLQNAEKCDELCELNIGSWGRSLLERVSRFENKSDTDNNLLKIFEIAYRFLVELEFKQIGELSSELLQIKNWTREELPRFPEDVRQSLVWANYMMPAEIVKNLIHDSNFESIRQFNSQTKSAEELQKNWTKEIEEKRLVVDALKQDLDKYETSYNFVGLVDGFKDLLVNKRKERNFAFLCLLGIGLLILVPLSVEVGFILSNIDSLDSIKNSALLILPPTIAIEIFLFYFFRVVLIHFRTVKAHILQLDLRVSLCRFIQSYTKYAAEIKKSDPASLQRFESLIFSGIVSNDEKLPSTLDGLDQLSGLVQAIRGK